MCDLEVGPKQAFFLGAASHVQRGACHSTRFQCFGTVSAGQCWLPAAKHTARIICGGLVLLPWRTFGRSGSLVVNSDMAQQTGRRRFADSAVAYSGRRSKVNRTRSMHAGYASFACFLFVYFLRPLEDLVRKGCPHAALGSGRDGGMVGNAEDGWKLAYEVKRTINWVRAPISNQPIGSAVHRTA